MLVLTRKINESIKIGDDIEIMITDVRRGRVKVGIVAPRDVRVIRPEVLKGNEESKAVA
jgi:carbon storage regulator